MNSRLGRWLALIVLLLSTASASADRDIVFSAQFYRWSGSYYRDRLGGTPEKILENKGPYHLYRMNVNGARVTRITSGQFDDVMPQWASDGRYIFFVRLRLHWDAKKWLCRVPSMGGRVTKIDTLPNATDWSEQAFSLSPDGRYVAYPRRIYYGSSMTDPADAVFIVDLYTRAIRKIPRAVSIAWSPDGKNAYLSGVNRILHARSGRLIRAPSLRSPFWVDSRTVFGASPPRDDNQTDLRFVSVSGQMLSRLRLPEPHNDPYLEGARIVALPHSWFQVILVQHHGMSDGAHFTSYTLDLTNGRTVDVGEGRFLAVSPSGAKVLIGDDDWIGPYKHGGRRCGRVWSVNLRTGAKKAIIGRLVSVFRGDCRGCRVPKWPVALWRGERIGAHQSRHRR